MNRTSHDNAASPRGWRGRSWKGAIVAGSLAATMASASVRAEPPAHSAAAEPSSPASNEPRDPHAPEPSPSRPSTADLDLPDVQGEPADLPIAGYDGGFFVQSPDGDYRLRLGGRIQARFTYEHLDRPEPESRYAFSIPRAWLKVRGHLFTPDLKYRVFVDFGKGKARLLDGFVDYRAVPDALHVRIGQWRTPWTRQFINPIPVMAFQERSILMGPFGAGRDVGVAVHNGYDGKKPPTFEYVLGAFNGTGIGTLPEEAGRGNVPFRFAPTLLARAALNHGRIGYREVDFDGGPLRLSVGAGVRTKLDVGDSDDGNLAFGIDGALQAYGLTAMAEVLVRTVQDGASYTDLVYEQTGVTAMFGYMIEDTVQPSVRYSRLMPKEGSAKNEFMGSFILFPFQSPNVRLMLEGGATVTEEVRLDGRPPSDRVDHIFRNQLQIDF